MHYEVFLLSRIREEWLQSQNNRAAVASELVTTKEIGVGVTVAVLVDATFIRLLLVPATMRLLGRWNWWLPGRPSPPR
jgi:putative drug exporter of the RND superfamily